MASFAYVVGAYTFSLSDGELCEVYEAAGIDEIAYTRQEERAPGQHGSTDLGATLNPRLVRLVLGVEGATPASVKQKTRRLEAIFHPNLSGQLSRVAEDGVTRFVDTEPLSLTTIYHSPKLVKLAVELKGSVPTWRPVAFSTLALTGTSADETSVPTEVPTEVGASEIDATVTLEYPGTWESYPVIIVVGQASSVRIEQVTTGDVIELVGPIGSEEVITIDLRDAVKLVTDADGNERMDLVGEGSDLATWAIAHDPYLYLVNDGLTENEFRVTATGVDAQFEVVMSYLERYTEA